MYEIWFKLSAMLTNMFFHEGRFSSTKTNGTAYSVCFLKFIVRVLHNFPVDVPERCIFETESTIASCLADDIQYTMTTIKQHIRTSITTRLTTNERSPNTANSDNVPVPIISRGELTRLNRGKRSTQ
eukprot:TRINITY_DN136777_c1_g1_i1.p1 TRINITY_DN136777_c1_g1~~TRINITY_DN136777_c1_g1_i1.p1  ORF type:complete len:127 (+),score=11.27 TRINITY_DN136777_c1_g1_i1:56-436(+)